MYKGCPEASQLSEIFSWYASYFGFINPTTSHYLLNLAEKLNTTNVTIEEIVTNFENKKLLIEILEAKIQDLIVESNKERNSPDYQDIINELEDTTELFKYIKIIT